MARWAMHTKLYSKYVEENASLGGLSVDGMTILRLAS